MEKVTRARTIAYTLPYRTVDRIHVTVLYGFRLSLPRGRAGPRALPSFRFSICAADQFIHYINYHTVRYAALYIVHLGSRFTVLNIQPYPKSIRLSDVAFSSLEAAHHPLSLMVHPCK